MATSSRGPAAIGNNDLVTKGYVDAGGALIQSELDALSDVVVTKATQSNVDAQLATKANATDLDNVFGIATAAIPSSQRAAANGVATLGADSKLPAAQLPALAITEFLGSSANQAAMLAKTGQQGDWTTRTDLGTVWIITGSDPTQLASWTALTYPTAPVTTVSGRTGAVVLTKTDVGLNNVDNTADSAKSFTGAQVAIATTTTRGTVELATGAEATTGTAADLAITPATLKTVIDGILASTPVAVQWNGTSWGTYSTDPNRVRLFFSQNDAAATAPTWYNSRDAWYKQGG